MKVALAVTLALSTVTVAWAMTTSEKDLAVDSYNNVFYVESSSDLGYYVVDTQRGVPTQTNFWRTCEQIEALEDAYERTQNPTYGGMVAKLVNGLNQVVSGTDDWASWNNFNDDIMWGVIALARAYEITGNAAFLTQAEVQFNAVWSRGWDAALGGGLWWNTDKQTKNACVNFPATIAAMYLAKHTQKTGFRSQADALWTWSRAHLYDASTGRVIDHLSADGTPAPATWSFTYNQGTFIGAAYLLFQDTTTASYIADCSLAATWTKVHLTNNTSGILMENGDKSSRDGGGDGPGFKGIFARWCSRYAIGDNQSEIQTWLTANADAAWAHRNPNGVTWAQWWLRTPDSGVITSWECSSGLSITQNAP
jgi:predicted alpha-1,6-mannanase (GH76 family)